MCQSLQAATKSIAKCLKVIISYYSLLNIKTNRELYYFKITSLLKLVTYCDWVTILKSFTASVFFRRRRGGGGAGVEREAKWLGYGGPGNKPSTLPLTGLFLNGSLGSTPWLCFVFS